MNRINPVATFKTGAVDMTHGGGGRAMAELIDNMFLRHLKNPFLDQRHDSAIFSVPSGRLVMSTDGHVISPLFFPGGNIGSLAVHGTLNDIAMSGARPLYLTAGFILEEGFPLSSLEQIVISMAQAAHAANVAIVTGDTKVVEKGKGDGVFITTTGLGIVPDGVDIGIGQVRADQRIIVSGSIGDHGVAILSKRENLEFETTIRSDSAALHDLVAAMVEKVPSIAMLRDPTRGGVAATLNEIAQSAEIGILLDEALIPVKADVSAACELLGLDPLYVANEGKLLCFCEPDEEAALLETMRRHPLGRDAAAIGTVQADERALVRMETRFGGVRVVDWLAGEQLPRIC